MISALTAEQLPACVALYVDVFNGPPWNESWDAQDAAQRLGDILATPRSHGVCLVAPDGAVLGFALGHLERNDAGDHFQLQEMCVRADAQRRGHGTRLLAALTERLADVRQWYLLTAHDSAAATFYATAGFRAARRMGVYVRP